MVIVCLLAKSDKLVFPKKIENINCMLYIKSRFSILVKTTVINRTLALCKTLVFNGRCCHFIHQFMANLSQSFKKDLTVGLILKHYEQAKRIQKLFFVKILGKLRTIFFLMFSVFDRIN